MKILLALFTMFVSAQSFASTTGACCCQGRHIGPNGHWVWLGCELEETDKGEGCPKPYFTYWTTDNFPKTDWEKMAEACKNGAVPARGIGSEEAQY